MTNNLNRRSTDFRKTPTYALKMTLTLMVVAGLFYVAL